MAADANKELHRIVATCLIHKDGKCLITRRALNKNAFPGKWTVPGGGLSEDDYINSPPTSPNIWYFALENVLRRELMEEVGLEVGKISYLLDLVLIRPDGVRALTLSFYAPWKAGEVKLNEESIDFAWVSFEEAKKYDLIGGILEEIEMADKILKAKTRAR